MVAVSRFALGSSARSRTGSATIARAMATRCCWPPDILPGAPAGELREAQGLQRGAGPVPALRGGNPLELKDELDVLERRKDGDQVAGLEDEADPVQAKVG